MPGLASGAPELPKETGEITATVEAGEAAFGDALAASPAAGGGGDASPGSAGQDSTSMMGFSTATAAGTVAAPGRFHAAAAAPAFFAPTGLSDGGVPAPATAACASALVAIVRTLIRRGDRASRRRETKGGGD